MIQFDNEMPQGPDVSQEIGAFQRQPKNPNNLLVNKVSFDILKLPETSFKCTGVVIPSQTASIALQSTSCNPIPLPGRNITFDPLVIKFIVDEDLNNWMEISQWMREMTGAINASDYNLMEKQALETVRTGGWKSDAVATLLDAQGNPHIQFFFRDAFPFHLGSLPLSQDEQTADVVTIEAHFQYAWFDRIKVT